MSALLLVNLVLAALLTGLIWTIQLVHYPLLTAIDPAGFPPLHQQHARRIGPLVGPLMLAELLAALLLWSRHWPDPLLALQFLLVAAIWITTGLVQVPLHRQLASRPSARTAATLVRTNWIRTILWSARLALLLLLTFGKMQPSS